MLLVAVLVRERFGKLLEKFWAACLVCYECVAVGSGLHALQQEVNHCHTDQTCAIAARSVWMWLCVYGGEERVCVCLCYLEVISSF